MFDKDKPETWLKANPLMCPHHDAAARAQGRDFVHYFGWPEEIDLAIDPAHGHSQPRNVWNPLAPRCKRCGATVGDVILHQLPMAVSTIAHDHMALGRLKKLAETLKTVDGSMVSAPDFVHQVLEIVQKALAYVPKEQT